MSLNNFSFILFPVAKILIFLNNSKKRLKYWNWAGLGNGKNHASVCIPRIMRNFAVSNNWSVFGMWDNDNILQVLRSSLGGAEVRALAKEVPCSLLLPRLYDEDIRVARNAAWVLTHKPVSQIRTLPYNDLIDLTMVTPDTSLRRLTLNLVEKQEITEESMRTDFLDFCLLHMHMPEEPPGVQALCMKLAHGMCLPYPELLHEFYETLSLMQPEDCKPGMKHLINKMKNQQ